LLILLSSLTFGVPVVSSAHEVTPTIGNFSVENSLLTIELRLNAEALIAGIDLDGLQNTDSSDSAKDYDDLRLLSGSELTPMLELALEDWIPAFQVLGSEPVRLELVNLNVAEVRGADLPRPTLVTITASLGASERFLKFHWPKGSGALVLRQNGVAEPYTGYLQGGETSPPIAVLGGAVQDPSEVFFDYIPIGFDHILPKGLDHILFVLGLFFLSLRLPALFWQITCFTLAHSVTLALGILGLVKVHPGIVEPLIAASIIFVAVENIFVRRLHSWRAAMIFGFGLLHGLGFATVLSEVGLPPNHLFPALFGFNVGVELGQLAVIAAAYATIGYWFGKHPKYRGRVAMPASLTIALIGGYWLVERLPDLPFSSGL